MVKIVSGGRKYDDIEQALLDYLDGYGIDDVIETMETFISPESHQLYDIEKLGSLYSELGYDDVILTTGFIAFLRFYYTMSLESM